MKRLLAAALALCLCLGLFGCSQPEDARPCRYFKLTMYAMEKKVMDAAALDAAGCEYYLKLYDDGTGELKIDNSDPKTIGYDDHRIWPIDTPDAYATYTTEGKELTVLDGIFTFIFREQPQ